MQFFWTFYSPKYYHGFYTNIKQQLFSTLIIRNAFFAANQIQMQILMQN